MCVSVQIQDMLVSKLRLVLQKICDILSDPVSSVSAFEFMYCKVHIKLKRYQLPSVHYLCKYNEGELLLIKSSSLQFSDGRQR